MFTPPSTPPQKTRPYNIDYRREPTPQKTIVPDAPRPKYYSYVHEDENGHLSIRQAEFKEKPSTPSVFRDEDGSASMEAFNSLCRKNDVVGVQKLIDKHSSNDISKLDLYAACSSGSLEVVKLLYITKPEIFEPLSTPFFAACESGNVDLIRWFVSINDTDIDHISALVMFENACSKTDLNVAKVLLELFPEIKTVANILATSKTALTNQNFTVHQWLKTVWKM